MYQIMLEQEIAPTGHSAAQAPHEIQSSEIAYAIITPPTPYCKFNITVLRTKIK